jgi:hypothetical protein
MRIMTDQEFEDWDGREFEVVYEAMVCRFRDAHLGVPGADVELALRAERNGDESLLNGLLSRQIHATDFNV